MTLNEFETIKKEKNKAEYEAWFDLQPWSSIFIGKIEHPCIELSSNKVALWDGSLFQYTVDNDLRELNEKEKRELQKKQKLMMDYDSLTLSNKLSVRNFTELLVAKEREERDALSRNSSPEGICCAFCGKKQDEVRRMFSGPKGGYICDACVDICSDMLESEFRDS